MAKEKANLYMEMQFDSYAYAQSVVEERTAYLESIAKYVKLAKYQLIALGATVLLSLIFSNSLGNVFVSLFYLALLVGFGLGIYCYAKIGGVKTAFTWGLNIGKFCWYVIPIFPVDIAFFFAGLIYTPLAILFAPYFIVRHQEK